MSGNEPSVHAQQQAKRAALGSFVGAVVDWYDFILYGLVAALVFNEEFFPNVSPAIGTLAAFATFGVGFLFRPLGGVVFGHFGDRIGRKQMLVLTITVMGTCTALIGVLPAFATIGWWAPILLVILRAVQGFAVGGEWGGAALMAVENAPDKRKALYSSGVQMGYSVGLILATGFVMLMNATLSNAAFTQWGWRIPFLASVVLVIIGLWVRSSVEESEEFLERKAEMEQESNGPDAERKRIPLVDALKKHPKAFLQIIGLRFVELFSMYIVTTFALSYSTKHLGMERGFMLYVGLLVGAVGLVTIPVFAHLSDRYGRRRIYILGSAIGAACAFPFFLLLQGGSLIGTVIFAVLLVNIAHDMVVSVQQPLFTEMFGAEYRYSGAGVGYQAASAIGGGFTPFIAAALVTVTNGSWHLVAVYLAAGSVVSGLIAWSLGRDHGRRSGNDVASEAEENDQHTGRVKMSSDFGDAIDSGIDESAYTRIGRVREYPVNSRTAEPATVGPHESEYRDPNAVSRAEADRAGFRREATAAAPAQNTQA